LASADPSKLLKRLYFWPNLDQLADQNPLLDGLGWSGVEGANRQRIIERGVCFAAIHVEIIRPFRQAVMR
jgi:hypothetical protein